jgi:hypothetical protein
MEGLVKDAGSRAAGTQRYRIPFGKSLRNRLGERQLIPVAPGLFAVPIFNDYIFRKVHQATRIFARCLLTKQSIFLLAVLILIKPVDKAHAVVLYQRNLSPARYSVGNSRAQRDLYGYYSLFLPYPGRVYNNFKEGDNIEWIYDALENQYEFLDDTLYRISGGNYLLGPVCYPYWHGFRYYYRARDIDRRYICAADTAIIYIEQGDMVNTVTLAANHERTWQGYSLSSLRDTSGRTYSKSGINVDVKAVPEPSTIALFGLVALKILMVRRVTGN